MVGSTAPAVAYGSARRTQSDSELRSYCRGSDSVKLSFDSIDLSEDRLTGTLAY